MDLNKSGIPIINVNQQIRIILPHDKITFRLYFSDEKVRKQLRLYKDDYLAVLIHPSYNIYYCKGTISNIIY